MKNLNRNRLKYALLIILVIIVGLASRKLKPILPAFINANAGDTLWALMVFLIFCFLYKKSSTIKNAVKAILFSYAIEISQLYHAPWIDNIRTTTLGGLVLGFTFSFSDIVCYSIGIFIGFLVEIIGNKASDFKEI